MGMSTSMFFFIFLLDVYEQYYVLSSSCFHMFFYLWAFVRFGDDICSTVQHMIVLCSTSALHALLQYAPIVPFWLRYVFGFFPLPFPSSSMAVSELFSPIVLIWCQVQYNAILSFFLPGQTSTEMVMCVCVFFFDLNQDHRNHTFEKLSVAYGRRRKKIRGEAAGLRRRRKVWCYWLIPLSSKFYYYFLVLYTYWKELWLWQMSVFSIIWYITSIFVLGWFFATW